MCASRWAAARSRRACHSSALHSESVFGETLNCMSLLPLEADSSASPPQRGARTLLVVAVSYPISTIYWLKLPRACHLDLRLHRRIWCDDAAPRGGRLRRVLEMAEAC